MAEGDSWLCEHLQYYGIGAKPLFFLVYEHDDAHIEMMFRKALLYGAGFASYPAAMPSVFRVTSTGANGILTASAWSGR